MNLYLITKNADNDCSNDYNIYISAVVAARSKEDAQKIHPSGDNYDWDLAPVFRSWPSSYDQVTAKTIGTAVKRTKTGVIVAEFKGGE